MKTTFKIALLIIAIIVGFMYYGCENSINNNERTKQMGEQIVSEQPLCCNITVEENGRQVVYKFSCYNMVMEERQESKFLTFFYKDKTVAYSFDINNVMNGSDVFYAPDCD